MIPRLLSVAAVILAFLGIVWVLGALCSPPAPPDIQLTPAPRTETPPVEPVGVQPTVPPDCTCAKCQCDPCECFQINSVDPADQARLNEKLTGPSRQPSGVKLGCPPTSQCGPNGCPAFDIKPASKSSQAAPRGEPQWSQRGPVRRFLFGRGR